MTKLEEAANQEPAFRPEDVRILLVDDNRHMRTLLREHMFVLGFKDLIMAADGEEALAMLGDTDVDLVICDYRMPKMDGIELLQTMRDGGEKRLKEVGFIMLTGHADRDNVIEAKGAGVSGYLAKPISIKSLADQLVYVLNLKMKGVSHEARSKEPSEEPSEEPSIAGGLMQRLAKSA